MDGRAAAATGSKPASLRLHGTGSAHRNWKNNNSRASFCYVDAVVALNIGYLHINTGTKLGYILGLPEAFAKTQKLNTDLVTYETKRQKNFTPPRSIKTVLIYKKYKIITNFSCVVKISKTLLASIWLSILSKGTDTLKKEE